jgi:hypothetical protein
MQFASMVSFVLLLNDMVVVYADKKQPLTMAIRYDDIADSEYFCNKPEHTITEFYYDSH